MDKNFTHLHVHTVGSFLDGFSHPIELVKKAKEYGMDALAITDHNSLSYTLEFQKACVSENIKPLLGLEAYYTHDTNILSLDAKVRNELAEKKAIENNIDLSKCKTQKQKKELYKDYIYDTTQYHIILIAKNQIGWNNLVKLQSESADKCTFNGRYTIDLPLLKKYSEGIICSTACIGSLPAQYIINNKTNEAIEHILKLKDIFNNDFYLELQPLFHVDQLRTNIEYIKISKKYNIKLISTNDVHYTNFTDHDDHDTLLCIGIGKMKSDEYRMKYSNEFWLRSYDEMISAYNTQKVLFSELSEYETDIYDDYIDLIEESLLNTNEIKNKVTNEKIQIGSKTPLLPKATVPKNTTPERYLTKNSYKELYNYLKDNKDLKINEYESRLNFELNVINKKGYADYMLIVKDLVDWCESNNIPTGPGRGSAAGSLVLFLNKITKCIDPIKYGLLFSRFLTMDRTALPDIDTDFSYVNRHLVIEYLKEKYGHDCVSSIGTITSLGVKSGLKDVGRVLNIDFDTMNKISKQIDTFTGEDPGTNFALLDDLKNGTDTEKKYYEEFKKLEEENKELFRLARRFEGIPRNAGVHASGILVTNKPINDYFPTRTLDDGTKVTLFDGPTIESLNGVKLDILGLKTLDVLDIAMKSVDSNKNIYDLYNIVDKYLSDEQMFKNLNNKETEGIFQLESDLFKGLIGDIIPNNIEDITVITSIGRPGPLSSGLNKMYANRKNGLEEAIEPLKNTWDIVKDSLGILCYQEHCMRIAQRVAGFDDNQADSFLRKSMAKKKRDLMALCDQWFVYGKINQTPPEGYDYDNKEQVYYDPNRKYGNEIAGGLKNGYDLKDMKNYLKTIAEFCTYLFNKSHAATYSFLTCCTMYLKTYHKVEFFAALLSLQSKQEDIGYYIKTASKLDIKVTAPDINISDKLFKPVGNTIVYGLKGIKSVGEGKIDEIINNRPYNSIEDAMNKIPKKILNKTVGEGLILSGAFDNLYKDVDNFNLLERTIPNRIDLLKNFYTIRKDKIDLDELEDFSIDSCIELEKKYLGNSITFTPWWDGMDEDITFTETFIIKEIKEQFDKNGKLMARLKLECNNTVINSIVFSSTYCKNLSKFILNQDIKLRGKKDSKGSFIISSIAK